MTGDFLRGQISGLVVQKVCIRPRGWVDPRWCDRRFLSEVKISFETWIFEVGFDRAQAGNKIRRNTPGGTKVTFFEQDLDFG